LPGVSISHDLFDLKNAVRTHHPHTILGLPASLEDDDLGPNVKGSVGSLGDKTDMELEKKRTSPIDTYRY